jgi:hypothetical protein
MSFSIKNLRNRPVKVALRNPVSLLPIIDPDSNTAVELEITGTDSKVFAEAMQVCRIKVGEAMKAANTLDPSVHSQLTFELFASLVVGWNETAANFIKDEFDGDGSYTPEKAAKLLHNPDYYWIVKQIEISVEDRQRFFQKQWS